MAGEVYGFAVAGFLHGLEQRGLSREELLRGLDLRPEALRPPYGWCDWGPYAVLLERVMERLGSWGMEEAAGQIVSGNPTMRLMASAVVSPVALYTVFCGRVATQLNRTLGYQVRDLGGGRVLFRGRLLPGYRPCLPVFVANIGLLRHYPELIAAPPARVEADISPTRGDYLVTLPPSATVPARIQRALTSLRPAEPSDSYDALRHAVEISRLDPAIRSQVERAGRRIAASRDPEVICERLADFLAQHFCCDHVRLWLKLPGRADLVPAGSRGSPSAAPANQCTRELTVDGELVGRVQADLDPPEDESQAASLDALLSWTAIGLRGALERSAAVRGSSDLPGAGLTPRQREVLGLLVRGLANKEIAAELGCSVKTVEVHVGEVLRKSGVESRSALAALYWQNKARGSPAPTPVP